MKMPLLLTGLALPGALGCEGTSAPSEAGTPARVHQSPETAPSFAAWPDEVNLVGAGDIAWCSGNGDEATAKLLDTLQGTVFTALRVLRVTRRANGPGLLQLHPGLLACDLAEQQCEYGVGIGAVHLASK
jgi:hypothetical protein